ncbi:winged helix-turn-helix domain-containing protein [Amycolatopsis sp. DG1A-15b]|uniref:ArsR/SmtB family transcription factor n=1 Tax=Amycolatopsis sp. DG1A-15b TaxID=3052846 RepID=UPI00255BD0C6|nr:winged helix-turn-helix domain-containing protein [Amycolatopsis sp. DG1A-15b]WIX93203.1 winged helix-turn-helix domain-containing protein [Amycolatopsis sp. DG1A-15b]
MGTGHTITRHRAPPRPRTRILLAETLFPSTTGSLAHRVGLAPATVSEHLTVLREAGLVTATRRGREVLYRQTPLAAALLRPDPV